MSQSGNTLGNSIGLLFPNYRVPKRSHRCVRTCNFLKCLSGIDCYALEGGILRVVSPYPPFVPFLCSFSFNFCVGPPLSHFEESLLWLL
jgi:hypothetical protein